MTFFMLCALWFGGDQDPTIRYAKGSALSLKIAAGLWINKSRKGYCVVGDKLYNRTSIGPKDEHPKPLPRNTSPVTDPSSK